MAEPIFHLVPLSALRDGLDRARYTPASLAHEGFVHCSAGRDVTLAVANDYFADLSEPLLVLALDPERLSSDVRYEAPAPIPGGGGAHLAAASLFPHVYGPLDRDAIAGAGVARRDGGAYRWPDALEPLDALLARA